MGRELTLFDLIAIAESDMTAEQHIAGSTSTEECDNIPNRDSRIEERLVNQGIVQQKYLVLLFQLILMMHLLPLKLKFCFQW